MNYRPTETAWWEREGSTVCVAGLEPDDQDELDAALPDYDERRKDRRLFG